MASEHMLQRFSVNAEGFSSPTEIVMVYFQRAHRIVSLEILERHPTGNLRST
jgi:hypothetical protein